MKIDVYAQKFLFICIVGVAVFQLAGCGAKSNIREMALDPGDDAASLQGSHILLLSMKTDNQFKPGWPPEVWAIEIVEDGTGRKIEIAVQSMSATALLKKGLGEAAEMEEETSSWEGLISFDLPPGSYTLSAVRGGCVRSVGTGVAVASFDFPFAIGFTVDHEQFAYLGRIEMTNRQRLYDDEIPAGDNTASRLPQKQSGFGTGTFDVTILDNYDRDMQQFTAQYAVLTGQVIVKRILPRWTPPKTEG